MISGRYVHGFMGRLVLSFFLLLTPLAAVAQEVLAEKPGVVGQLDVYRGMDGRCVLPRARRR